MSIVRSDPHFCSADPHFCSEAHRERLKFKLGAANLHQLIRIAVLRSDTGTTVVFDVNEPLTERERQAFALLGEGKSTQEIACHLNHSRKLTQAMCTRIKGKLEIDSFEELI